MPSEFARQEWLQAFWGSVKAGTAQPELSEKIVSPDAWLAAFWRSYDKAMQEEHGDAVAASSVTALEEGETGVQDWVIVDEDARPAAASEIESSSRRDQPKYRQAGSTESQ